MSEPLTLINYLDLMSSKYLHVCKNRSVLEIGPLDGVHTKIVSHTANRLTLIEPDVDQIDNLKQIHGVTDIINDDVNFVLTQAMPYDVVVCCGLLYHLHSPLHLLELIANNCNPQYIILDSVNQYVNSPNYVPYNDEELNIKGDRFVRSNWKAIRLNQSAPYEIINKAMDHLGYSLLQKDDIKLSDWDSKSNSWMALWEKK